jgi:tetratricopeptide (TPR) repeat protein
MGAIALLAALPALPVLAAGQCVLGRVAEMPITMAGTRPLISAKIDGKEARFILDSGAFFSMMSAATAAEFNLKLRRAPFGFRVRGVGGSVSPEITTVKEFDIAGAPIHDVDFLAGGSEVGAEGVLGQNFLEQWDVEYDFSKGVVRLFKPDGCKKTNLAYWLVAGQSYSVMQIESVSEARWHTVGEGYVNGKKIRVLFDTGAYYSVLSLQAAERAGIKIGGPGVTYAGYSSGLGSGMVKTYIATASSFKIGDGEEIKNARLRVADLDFLGTDMLLGSDFFVSHHVFVANSQRKLYLSYNGGPVFNLTKTPESTTAQLDQPPKEDAQPEPQAASPAEQADADALARQGEASAARHDFEQALAELSKAVESRPDEPEYLYQRALVYRQNRQADLALADLDRVLTLDPNFLRAYLPRAEIRLAEKNMGGAREDLDAVDRLAPKQSDLRFILAHRYEAVDQFSQAIAQFDLWIQNHPVDSRLAMALEGRCAASAAQNEDLAGGLADCNKAMYLGDKKDPNYGHLYAVRGMLEVRQGNYEKSISDFSTALKTMPKDAAAFYGRGVAKIRDGKNAEGLRDIDEAAKIAPGIADRYKKQGLAP